MNKLMKQVISLFSTEVENFKDIVTDEKRIFRITEEEVKTEIEIKEVTEDGIIEIENGEYVIVESEDKSYTITITDGIITEIKDVEIDENEKGEESEDESKSVEAFKAIKVKFNDKFDIIKEIYTYDIEVDNTENEFKIGDKVTITYEYEGEKHTYDVYQGTYALSDGRLITINQDGIIILITDSEGNVLEAPTVDENVTETKTENETEIESETITKEEEEFLKVMKQFVEDFNKQTIELNKLKDEFNILKNKPSGNPIKREDFSEDKTITDRKMTHLEKAILMSRVKK